MALWQIKGGLLMEEINATRIKETIIDLTDKLGTDKQLWEAYKVINKGLMYLGAKHTMLEVKNKD
tara:strand:- start:1432 stop:1626 length:195 start_codon:yes stop_codon:yes gene_type:complete